MTTDATEPRRLQVGATAPAWELTTDEGAVVSSEDLRGKRYLLYFYAKDDTPGCTTQACGIRDSFDKVTDTGIEVFGVSPDGVESHRKFREKYALPYRLLSDEGHRVADAFGVWVLKKFAGREYYGNERTSFVIGPDGTIEHVLPQVKPEQHVTQLLEALAA